MRIFRADNDGIELPDNASLICYRGSYANNTFTENSDVDLACVVFPSLKQLIGLDVFGSQGTIEIKQPPYEAVMYDIRKAVRMFSQANPNLLPILFTRNNEVLLSDQFGKRLIENRHLFLSKQIRTSFLGFSKNNLDSLKPKSIGNLGEKRRSLIERFGFDCKAAAYGVMYLHLLCEVLLTGTMNVWLEGDIRGRIVAIKTGEWSHGSVAAYIGSLLQYVEECYSKSVLPETVDNEAIENLLLEMIEEKYEIKIPV